jgi:DNA (cytosine-5)-methyltransferase 1
MNKKLSVISLFTGAGGLDYGFEAAGFETRVAIELDKVCCASLRASRNWSVICDDLLDVPSKAILDVGRLQPQSADMLIGGPPCQPFSKSGWWSSGDSLRLDDPRADTLSGYLRVLRDVLPKAFLLENVEGLAFQGKDHGLKLLLSVIQEINRTAQTKYVPHVITLNAANYGVPQTRSRVFVVGSRDGRPFARPEETFADPGVASDRSLKPWRTAWDAIGDLSVPRGEELDLSGKWADLLPSIPEGQNYLWHTDRMGGKPIFGWRRRYWNFLLKLAKNRPAWTIQAQPGPATGPFHWNNRRLSSIELRCLQTFPKDVVITGGRADIQRQLGNAVPSLLAEVIAREIAIQFFDADYASAKLKLLPAKRSFVPAPEPIRPVPRKFYELIGKHAAHPGTRQGPLYAEEELETI